MLTVTQSDRALDVQAIPAPVYTHIVTLIHRISGHEACIKVETFSTRFAEVMREVAYQKVMQGLLGYEVFEVLDCNDPF